MKAVKTQERLFEEFIDFQKMPKTEIQQFVWIEASVREPSDDEDINYCRMYGLRLVYEEPSDDEDINYCCMYGLRLVYEEPSDDEDINYCCMYGLRLVYKSLQMMKTLTIAVCMD